MTRLLIPYITWTCIIFCIDHKPFILENILDYFVFRPRYGLWFLQNMMLYCLFVLAIFVTLRYIPKKFRQLFENILLLSFMIALAFFGRRHFFFYLICFVVCIDAYFTIGTFFYFLNLHKRNNNI